MPSESGRNLPRFRVREIEPSRLPALCRRYDDAPIVGQPRELRSAAVARQRFENAPRGTRPGPPDTATTTLARPRRRDSTSAIAAGRPARTTALARLRARSARTEPARSVPARRFPSIPPIFPRRLVRRGAGPRESVPSAVIERTFVAPAGTVNSGSGSPPTAGTVQRPADSEDRRAGPRLVLSSTWPAGVHCLRQAVGESLA